MFLLGARTKNDLLELDLFRNYGEVYITTEDGTEGEKSPGEEGEEEVDTETTVRFPSLALIDATLAKSKPKNYDNDFTLSELIENFRCYAASQLKLYYFHNE